MGNNVCTDAHMEFMYIYIPHMTDLKLTVSNVKNTSKSNAWQCCFFTYIRPSRLKRTVSDIKIDIHYDTCLQVRSGNVRLKRDGYMYICRKTTLPMDDFRFIVYIDNIHFKSVF